MQKLSIILISLFMLSGCSISEIDEVKKAQDSFNDAKEKAEQIKSDGEEKVEQAQNLKNEFDEFSDAWDEFSN